MATSFPFLAAPYLLSVIISSSNYLYMKKIFIYLIFFIIAGCKEKYLSPVTSPSTGYLVAEGFINSGQEPTSITLSRSIRLIDSVNILYEHNAVVNIES